MDDTGMRPRRSAVVVLLDGVMRLIAVVHAGSAPTPKVRAAGARRGVGRYLLFAGVLAALAGTALLVLVLVRAPGGSTPPPDRAAALPGLRSQPVGPSVAGSTGPVRPSAAATPSPGKVAATVAVPATPVPSRSTGAPVVESTPVPLTASYMTSSTTAGLLGYQMTVRVANPGPTPKGAWTVTVTLPRPTLLVSAVSGATAAQNGSVWTFTPDATTALVPPGGSVELVFDVHGATLIDAAPQDCRIDDNRCGA